MAEPLSFDRAWLKECPSTQDAALAEYAARGIPVAVATDNQTAGRGRLGRTWVSQTGAGLATSLALPVASLRAEEERAIGGELGRLDAARLALAGGLASAMTARELAPNAGVALRWPNDTVAGGITNKLGGCLVEIKGGVAVVGIGINVRQSQSDWASELRGRPVSLLMLGVDTTPAELFPLVCAQFESLIGRPSEDLARLWREMDCLVGSRARFRTPSGLVEGSVLDIDPFARIVLSSSGREVAIDSATASLVLD